VATAYGGMGSAGYRDEVAALFTALSKADGLATYRRSLCVAPPWKGDGCDPPGQNASAAELGVLFRNHFTRSTTRTYAQLMKDILGGSRLPATVEAVMRSKFEVWLDSFPSLQTAFSRYGVKGGSLANAKGTDILTWTTYIQNVSDGRRFAVAVFLQGLTGVRNVPGGVDVQEFAQQFALSSTFREKVRNTLAAEDARDELVPHIKSVKRSGSARAGRAVKLVVKARVNNAGPRKSPPSKVALYLSDDGELDNGDELLKTASLPALKGAKGKNVTFRATLTSDPSGKFILVVADSDKEVVEQDEENNVLRERLRP